MMDKPFVRYGVIVGGIGLLLNICVSAALGVCGPIIGLIAGGVAGFLTVREMIPVTQADGAKLGAMSGGIAGGLIAIGQLIGGIGALIYLQSSSFEMLDTVPMEMDSAQQFSYWIGGIGVGVCLAFVGVGVAALVGAGVGYFTTSN